MAARGMYFISQLENQIS